MNCQIDCAGSYGEHLQGKLQRLRQALQTCQAQRIIIASGQVLLRFQDDLGYPFRANPYFLEHVPLNRQGCYLVVDRDTPQATLYFADLEDYWHSDPEPVSEELHRLLDVVGYTEPQKVAQQIAGEGTTLVIDSAATPQWPDNVAVNPEQLLNYLDYYRAEKSPWETHCIRQANRLAVKGHLRAEQLFRAGASEYDIHMGYLRAIGFRECELPYDNIIGLNRHAAVLHHQILDTVAPTENLSLLIDAGAACKGYASDITRTYANGPGDFADLLEAVDRMQQQIVAELAPGVPYTEFHIGAMEKMADVLRQANLVNASTEQMMEQGLVRAFFPHGLGHLLGAYVHDRGGMLANPQGDIIEPPEAHPYLRSTRTLEYNQVVTVEPGLYFIEPLLRPLREGPQADLVNWKLVEQLSPYGGIRVEDNVVLTDQGLENMTRDAFADQCTGGAGNTAT
ncbi:Xaa-Pro dipeptidase [Porticoccus sp. GXU_MW_L64]